MTNERKSRLRVKVSCVYTWTFLRGEPRTILVISCLREKWIRFLSVVRAPGDVDRSPISDVMVQENAEG